MQRTWWATLSAVTAAAIASVAAAGDAELYYREVERAGRLYVFADAGVHGRWQRGEAIPAPVTLRAYGPRGQDVVFDSQAAARLYDERRASGEASAPAASGPGADPAARAAAADPAQAPAAKPAADPAAEPPGTDPAPAPATNGGARISWDHGTTIDFGNASIKLDNRIQFRFTDEFPPDSLQLPGTEAPGDSRASFKIRRAKTELGGWFLWPELTFQLQVGWAGSDAGAGEGTTFSGLEDAYLDWDISKRGLFRVRGGQFKVPFGRQEFTSSERQEFADRSILSFEMTHSRDVGVMLWGATEQSKLAWAVGGFNGNGRNRPANDNGKLQWDGRLTFQPWGDVGFSEADLESTDHPLLALEGAFEHNDRHGATNANDFSDRTLSFGSVLKYRGLFLFGEYFWRRRTPESGAAFGSNGYHAQAGCFLIRHHLEAAARWASWDPTDVVAGNDITELGGVLNYYVRGHKLKATGDFRRLRDQGRGETAHELRIQVQFLF